MKNAPSKRRLDDEGIGELLQEPLPAKGRFRTVFDTEIPSFAVRISPAGAVTFEMVYSFDGRVRRYAIGRMRTPDTAKQASGRGLTIAQARKEAQRLRMKIDPSVPAGERVDIAAERSARREEARALAASRKAEAEAHRRKSEHTILALLEAYVEHLRVAGKPSAEEVARAINRHIAEGDRKLAAMPAEEVTVDDVMPVFHRITKAGKLREAEKLRAYLRAAYTAARKARTDATMHAFAGFQIRSNPLTDLDVTRPKEAVDKAAMAARERKWALSQPQLAAYWKRISADESARGALLRFHLLTGGQRVEQLGRLTVADYDPERKTVTLLDTKGRRKMAREHVIPLIPDAERALAAMRPEASPGPYLFTVSNGEAPAAYHTVWEAMQTVAREMVEAGEIDRVFTPGTLRKTVETRLQAVGVSREIRAHLGSHGLGGVQGQHYEAHEYDDEKRAALKQLRALCEAKGKPGNVTPIRRQAG